MKVRLLRDTDVELLLSLMNRTLRYDQLTPELLEEKVWDDCDFSNNLALVVEHDKRVIAFVMGVVRGTAPQRIGYIKFLVVDERYQRKGAGTRLLQEMEKRLRAQGVQVLRILESTPNYLVPGLDPRYTRAMIFFEKNGYQRFGETWNLDADLSREKFSTREAEKALVAKGVDIRRATASDADAMRDFLAQHWPAWIGEVSQSFKNRPVSLHLAFRDSRVIAFSAHNCNNFNTGWFGPMGTDPAARKLGIGGILLRRCLADIKNAGHRFATIPWVGPIAFYLRYAGAEVSRVFYRYEKRFEAEAGEARIDGVSS